MQIFVRQQLQALLNSVMMQSASIGACKPAGEHPKNNNALFLSVLKFKVYSKYKVALCLNTLSWLNVTCLVPLSVYTICNLHAAPPLRNTGYVDLCASVRTVILRLQIDVCLLYSQLVLVCYAASLLWVRTSLCVFLLVIFHALLIKTSIA